MPRRCGPTRSNCGMKGGLLNPFFQNGNDLSGYGLSSNSSYSVELQNVITKANQEGYTKPTSAQLSSEDEFLAWVLENYTTGLSCHIQGLGSIEFGTLNLLNPDVRQHIMSSPAPDFFSLLGIKSNGTSSYVRTGVTVDDVNETAYTIVIYISESSTAFNTNHRVFGARSLSASATRLALNPLNTATTGSREGYGAADTFANTDVKGYWVITGNATTCTIYKDYDGVTGLKDVQVVTPTAPTILNELLWLALNSNTAGGITAANFFGAAASNLLIIANEHSNDAKVISGKSAWDTFRAGVGLVLFASATNIFANTTDFFANSI